jgi:Holliday junction resolvase RusA-like endonuclease
MFVVHGTPAPKGSGRAMLIGGRARLIASSSGANDKAQRQWVKAVQTATQDAAVICGSVWVSVAFRLARPAHHYGTGKNAAKLKQSAPRWPVVYPDIDKLVRCTLDALSGVLFTDDSCVVSLYVGKQYAQGSEDEGATIRCGAWSEGTMLIHANSRAA